MANAWADSLAVTPDGNCVVRLPSLPAMSELERLTTSGLLVLRVIAQSELIDDAHLSLLASDIAKKIQSEMDYPGKIKITVIREMRATSHAR